MEYTRQCVSARGQNGRDFTRYDYHYYYGRVFFFLSSYSRFLSPVKLSGALRVPVTIYIESDSSLNDDTFLYCFAFFLDDDDGLTSVRRDFLFKFNLHPFVHSVVVNVHVNKLLIPLIALIVYANYLCTRRCDYTFIAMRRNIK